MSFNTRGKYFDIRFPNGIDGHIYLSNNELKAECTFEHKTVYGALHLNDVERIDMLDKNKIIIAGKSRPIISFEIEDAAFVKLIQLENPQLRIPVVTHTYKAGKVIWTMTLVTLVIIALAVLGYVFLLPIATEKLAGKIPVQVEQSIGKELLKSTLANYTIDTAKTRQTMLFFKSLQLEGADSVHVTVVKSKEVNAFALPGGNIVVFDSIINVTPTADAFAALLAHEYAHVQLRHSVKALVRQFTGTFLISIVMGDNAGVSNLILTNVEKLKGLQYSRKLENQADTKAVEYVCKAGLNPAGALELFTNLKKITGNQHSNSEFLSTHPYFDARLANVTKQIKHAGTCRAPNQTAYMYWQTLHQMAVAR